MTREEIQGLLAMVQAAYPNYSPPNKTAAVNVWTMALEEYGKDEVAMAFKVYLQTNTSGFAPTPGQLIDKIQEIRYPPSLNEQEAWSLVANAIRNGAYGSVEEFANLPPTVQKAVGQPSQLMYWAMDEDFNEEVAKSNFQRAYRIEQKRVEETRKMPKAVQELIRKAFEKSPKGEIEGKNLLRVNFIAESRKSEIKALELRNRAVPFPDRLKDELKDLKK